ncbi:telomeric repeat-binding factor 2-interacting protein 1-like [Oscarella lobularis]|uniref:telomeric repeat-binding factor 2-interacting protein 1-like n=1 Tax=Oscarella lobularis TaxID=121494 RepID=UPI003313B871
MAADYSDTLFVTGEGAPMKFYIAPGKEKQELKPLIEKGGGVVTGNEDKAKSIQLSTSSPAPAGSTPFQYVHDCISENRLLPLATYSSYRRSLDSDAINEEDAEDSGENEISMSKERMHENERTTHVKATIQRGRHPYNAEEDKKILNYVELYAGPAYGGTTGNRLWQHMEKMGVTSHTWQSMKSRYKRFIQPADAKPKRKNKPELEMESAEGRRNNKEGKKKTKKRVDESESESEDESDSDSSFDGELFKAGEVVERRRDATPARRLPSKRRTLASLLPARTLPKRKESPSKARRDVATSAPQLSSSARKKRESPPVKSDNPSKRKKLLTPFPWNSRNEDGRSTSSSHRNRHSNGSTPRSRRCLNEPMGRAKREEELRTRIKRIMSAYSKSHEQVSEALRCMSGNFDDACHFLEHNCSKTGQPPWTEEDDALLLSKSRAGKTLLLRKRSDLDVSRRIKFLESKPV